MPVDVESFSELIEGRTERRASRGTLQGWITAPLLVACLCAGWCGSCRDYEATFQRLSTEFGAASSFVWIDIEDEADKIGAVDVDNFPTLLIARAGTPLFFGAVTPHAQTLQRLVTSALAGELEPTADVDADIVSLAEQLTPSLDAQRSDESPN